MLYEKLPENRVRCHLCAHRCLIFDDHMGICQVRENQGGTLYTLVYGQIVSQHVDPVEKKPLLHFYPGSTAYSIATPGCNFRCRWCQNWEIAQMPREFHLIAGQEASPEEIVAAAQRAGSRSIAYTYTEPTIFFELAYDTARLAHGTDLANIYVTNGYMTPEMLDTFHPYLDAANVDLKAFRNDTYRKYVGAKLWPVLDSLKKMKALGIWVEVTTLVVPGINDDPAELKDAAEFVADELGVDTPWHISRFFPAYKMMGVAPTPVATLQRAREIGLEAGLRYVYVGNVPEEENTFCHQCGRRLIRRAGYTLLANDVRSDGCCPDCGTLVAGVGMAGGVNASAGEWGAYKTWGTSWRSESSAGRVGL
jgi:pyruvate formate lyase activating enzyme